MKRIHFFILLISSTLFSCQNEVKFTFENPLEVDRTDEVIVLSRADLAAKMDLAEGRLPVLKKADGETVPSQVDDLDGDGKWDELVLIVDFEKNQKLELCAELVAEESYPKYKKRTNLRLGIAQQDGSWKEVDTYKAIPYTEEFKIISQGEGVTWENDKIGFRVYFDCRNVKDLFGKLLPRMVADDVHTPEFGSYHELADWGMDVLHCGSSLGSGGIALLKNDSLFRVGSTDVYEYKKIVEGPFRSVFELRYSGWDVDGEDMEAVERITIYPGKYWFESDVTIKGCADNDQIVTGIVTSQLKDEPFAFKAADFQCIGTHGVQSLNNDELGMAVIVPKAEAGKIDRTSDINFFKLGYETVKEKGFSNIISETYYIGQKCQSGVPAKHYFFSVWGLEKDQWKTENGFKKYIGEEAEKLSAPIVKL
ncbi:DUF4861 domain-containing protein [Prolixibacteraceae bacterium Z1-6]|uniref:DUF4861 domain-containing protein n=1 Tax=Draconibacterium aestuarii TaxID=2998507 RepID=A0A9X3F982_9BACT|nr:DUF4861 domain-containing protein [Prolixibacteraceae bacterium Z1-6]